MNSVNQEKESLVPSIPIDWALKFVNAIYHKLKIGELITKTLIASSKDYIVIRIDFQKVGKFLEETEFLSRIRTLFRKEPKNTELNIKEWIVSKYNQSLLEDDKKYTIEIRDLHIIYEDIEYFLSLVRFDDFQKDLSRYVSKFIVLQGYFADFKLQKEVYYEEIVYECLSCGTSQPIRQDNYSEQIYPDVCMNPKCKNRTKKLFREVQEESEIRELRLFDLEGDNQNVIRCIILSGCEYFDEYINVNNIKLRQLIDVSGILWIYKKSDNEKDYVIEVNDIRPATETYKIDNKIVKEIKKELKKDDSYCDKLIDSIFPLTEGIYDFFPGKLLIIASIVTSDSWDYDNQIRGSLNGIIGGPRATFKSTTLRSIQSIIGNNNYGRITGKNATEKGLIPTAQRNSKEKNLVKRYGAYSYYNKRTLAIDEAQYLSSEARETLKCFEDGMINRALDGTEINAEVKGSILLCLNFNTANECYDYEKTLYENIYFPEDQKSILDRFDLIHAIPIQSNLVNKIIYKRDSGGKNETVITKNYIYNFLVEAKRLYSEGIKISQDLGGLLEDLYNNFLILNSDNKLSLRDSNILKRTLKFIASIRLKEQADNSDLIYLRKHLINTIIPFRDNKFLSENRIIDMNEIFKITFKYLSELHQEISIKEHIKTIRSFLGKHYFSHNTEIDKIFLGKSSEIEDVINPDIDNYMPNKDNLENYKYRKLIGDNDEILKFIESMNYELTKKDNKTYFKKITGGIVK